MKNEVIFKICGKQYEKLTQFVEKHKKCRGCSAGEKFSFTFVPTMIGVIATVRCICGKSLDVSDMDL